MNQNNNLLAQQVQGPVRVRERQFDGVHPHYIDENSCFGDEAQKYLECKFDYLAKQKNKLTFSRTKPHSHPYAAFCRKYFNQIILRSLGAKQTFIDVGGHAIRSTFTKRPNVQGVDQPWYVGVHSMLPLVDSNDHFRHRHWRAILENSPDAGAVWPLPNSCNNTATNEGLCKCVNINGGKLWRETSDYCAIDSAYYPGVIAGIEVECLKYDRMGYLTFHDYARAARNGEVEYHTFDSEAHVTITKDLVRSAVNGNQFYYEHKMVNTGTKDTWYREVIYPTGVINNHGFILYHVEDRLKQGPHDYLLVSMTPIKVRPVGVEQVEDMFYSVKEEQEVWGFGDYIEAKKEKFSIAFNTMVDVASYGYKPINGLAKATKKLISDIASAQSNTKCNKRMIVTVKETTKLGEYVVVQQHAQTAGYPLEKTYTVYPQEVSAAYADILGKNTTQSYTTALRKLILARREKNSEDLEFISCKQAVELAMYLAARDHYDICYMSAHDEKIQQVRKAQQGVFDKKSLWWSNIKNIAEPVIWLPWMLLYLYLFLNLTAAYGAASIQNLCLTLLWGTMAFLYNRPEFITRYIMQFAKSMTILFVVWMILSKFISAGVEAKTGQLIVERFGYDYALMCSMALISSAIWLKRMSKPHRTEILNRNQRRWLVSSCVRDKRRLDMQLNAGIVDPQWKFRNKEWDITGLNGQQAAAKLGCDKCGQILAGQIGPILRGSEYYEPTVIHNCKQTVMSAAIRACSNKLRPDPLVYKEWCQFFDKIEGQLLHALKEEGGIEVDLDKWLAKYPEKYREEMLLELKRVDLFETKNYVYDSFPKIELQCTPVPAEYKDEPVNDCKERQISSPSAAKKLAANAFTHELEKLADKYIDGYCGSKTWPEICAWVDAKRAKYMDPVFGFADGSGFDMTQIKMITKRFNKMIYNLIASGLITMDSRVDLFQVYKAYVDSEILKVNVNRGDVQYKTEGRASGDGWTSFGNTLLMASYYRFIFHKAGLRPDEYDLLNKSDDIFWVMDRKNMKRVDATIKLYMAEKNKVGCFGLGQIAKFVKWGNLEDGDYLSNMFFEGTHGCRMVRIPQRVFQTLSWSTKLKPHDKDVVDKGLELMYSKGACMNAWAEDLPIFGPLARKYMELGKPGPNKDFNDYVDPYRIWPADSDYEMCCDWMERKFDLSRQEIREIEEAISLMTDPFDEVSIPHIDKFLDV